MTSEQAHGEPILQRACAPAQAEEALLQRFPTRRALTWCAAAQNCYTGADKSMLIPNTLFRVGGAAVILTNRVTERRRAKYELQHVIRVHMGHIDMAYE